MYEENLYPLPDGDGTTVFAPQLAEMKRSTKDDQPAAATPQSVLRWADIENQPCVSGICRRLLLPGSRVVGAGNLRQLATLSDQGNSCLLCLNHRSNVDVPTLCALMEDCGELNTFQQLIWIAGRKLEEDVGMTGRLVQCFHRVIVTPPSWFSSPRSDDELREARMVNIAAERTIVQLRKQGWIFALFPTGTRIRPDDESTQQAIEQTDSYVRAFQYMVLGNINGCTLPVSKNHDMTRETPRLDQMVYTFGPVVKTEQWRYEAAARFPDLEQRTASARAIREDIQMLAPTSQSATL